MKASLFYREGNSDKVYYIQIEKEGKGWNINFQYGRRGSTLNCGQKTSAPVDYDEAEKIYNKVLHEKLAKGYQEMEGSDSPKPSIQKATKKVTNAMLPQLLNAVDDPETYIKSDEYLAQEKFDGERRIIQIENGVITQYNRKGQVIPITESFGTAKCNCVLDGEMIGNNFYVFDLLELDSKDIRNQTCMDRIFTLNKLVLGKSFHIVRTADIEREKRKLYNDLLKNNKEGIVFKKKSSLYHAGRPASGGDFLKVKFTKTATFIVANHTKGKRSVGLELIDGDKRVFMGKVTISPNKEIPAIGSLIEVRYLYCFKGGAVYQPSYLETRTDLNVEDAQLSQIVYKAENEEE